MTSKPIILLNIDSLMTEPLKMAIQTGKAPALEFLMSKGIFIPEVVSSFPTMSVTIDSSLLTGTYADQHGVPALNWYDIHNREMVNYGTGFRETIGIGFSQCLNNMFYRLNNVDLSKNVSTIFEDLGHINCTSASINSFVYRGNEKHHLSVPKFIQKISKLDQSITTYAPNYLSLGAFSKFRHKGKAPFMIGGNYNFVGKELRHLIKNNQLPDFTFCIFQDLDIQVHFKRYYVLNGIKKIDQEIQKVFNLYDSWEEAIQKNIWLVIGDNGHSATGWRFKEVEIDLRRLLSNYKIHHIKEPVKTDDQLVLSVNQRMAYIYVLDHNLSLNTIAEQLKCDKRIDVIAWKEGEEHVVDSGLKEGELRFKKDGNFEDEYKQKWDVNGLLDLLDISYNDDHQLVFNNYPDAFARLYGALNSHDGRFLVVNAKPGCEFLAQSTPFHIGGACHGSLHKQESLVPMIITGVNEKPQYPRMVDLKPYILKLINNEKGVV